MVSKKALRDFEIYAKGVQRLEKLKKELDSLDTRKFRKEEHSIRKKLRNVHLIPQIEYELHELKAKVAGIDRDYQKSKLDKKQSSKIRVLEEKSEDVKKIPHLRERVNYLKSVLEIRSDKLEKEIANVRNKKTRKQLSKKEIANVRNISSLSGKIIYLKKLHDKDAFQLEELEKLKKKVGAIPEIKRKVASLRSLFNKESEELETMEQKLAQMPDLRRNITSIREKVGRESEQIGRVEKRLGQIPNLRRKIGDVREKVGRESEQIGRVEKRLGQIPNLRRKIGDVRDEVGGVRERVGKEAEGLKEVEEKMGAIPGMQRRISLLAGTLGRRTQEMHGEEKDIEELKLKIDSLKHKVSMPAKKRIFQDIRELSEKIDKNKEELYKKLVDGMSESRWEIEQEKRELRDELNDTLAESKWLIEKGAQEINEQLLEEVAKLNQRLEQDKKDLSDKLLSQVLELKNQVSVLQKERENQEELLESEKRQKQKDVNEKQKELEEKEKEISKKEKMLDQGFPQPFTPPPRFSEMKLRELEPNIKIISEKGFKKSSEKSVEQDFNPALRSPLPIMPISNLDEVFELELPRNEQLLFPEVTSSEFEIEEHNKLIVEEKSMEPKVGKQVFGELKREELREVHHLPIVSTFEFEEKLKSALEQREEGEQGNRKIKKLRKVKKRDLFMKVEEFKQTTNNIENIKIRIRTLESNLKYSTSGKLEKHDSLSNLIKETEDIGRNLSKIDKGILTKIKEVQ